MAIEEFQFTESLEKQLSDLVQSDSAELIEELLENHSSGELARAISLLDEEERIKLIQLINSESAAELVEQLPTVQAVQLLEEAEPGQAAAIVDELPSDLQADLLSDLDSNDAEAILRLMLPNEAESARQLQQYDESVAGGLMVTELLRYPDHWTVAEVVHDLQTGSDEYRDYQIQYTYVCGQEEQLLGVLRLRDLLLGDRSRVLRDIMIPNPVSVSDTLSLAELHGFFQQHHYLGVPVTNEVGKLVGVVQRSDVDQAWIEQQDRSFLKRQGIVSGEEIRAMSLWQRASGRLSWLSLNIVLNLLAATIISRFESTLSAVIALTAFLPIISDMSGCSGNQSVAVSIRELMLGLVRPSDVFRVWMKELSVGVLNGSAVGLLLGTIAYLWKGNLALAIVIGSALTLNTIVAVSIGGIIPLILRKFGRDPAVASGPLLTTVTDMCGFFLVLSLASNFIEYLV
ncbi:magnesium transporter [Aureliella helgolandensis]|uniref:Magnesium transporter MgtE n=1 Tax=Aureliella helgolandensis TaxID=2527968 RepID=A0A518GFA0_9BACT|nr:magnesium transporter [Aureliella helgolandensis]QDV27281.1 Magnesium transporter MgtE [Aureliella helgolandensis]